MRVNLLHIPSGEMLLDEWADYCTEFSGVVFSSVAKI